MCIKCFSNAHFLENLDRHLTYKSLKDNLYIFYADCSCFDDKSLFEHYYHNLPQFRKDKVDAFIFDKDKYLSLGAWSILDYAFNCFDLNCNKYKINYAKYDKPYFEDCLLNFNLSHSGTKVLCAISNDEVGCDIQKIKKFDKKLSLYCMTKEENNCIDKKINDEKKSQYFYNLWTIKEGIIKCLGTGLSINPYAINVTYKSHENIYASIDNYAFDSNNFFIYSLHVFNDYSCSVCDKSEKKTLVKKQVDFTNVIN